MLKEVHKEEIEYNSTSSDELNKKYEKIQNRLDKLYDDKLDKKISEEFYEKKFEQYSKEKKDVIEFIQKHSKSSNQCLELGMNIYKLSQQGEKIYLKTKKQDEKRQLLRLVFDGLLLYEDKLTIKYSSAFAILAKAIEGTNRSKMSDIIKFPIQTFEPARIGSNKAKTGVLSPACPTWLRRWDSNPRQAD